ncbi:lantibiotic dehydratase [Nocardia sp. NPDC051052]|uniref:lantibiotic dehydratase n=1 Tax=Nocardia sp. NPDC051052 TaxID=3364322 RepID=UPI003792AFDD
MNTATSSDVGQGWSPLSPNPEVVVRTCGLDAAVAMELHTCGAAQIADDIRRLDADLQSAAGTLSDELHRVVGDEPDRSMRARLIALRRDIFNGRPPRPTIGMDELTDRLDRPLAARLHWYQAETSRRRRLREQGREYFDAESEAAIATLREAAGQPAFQLGLALASPDFTHDLLSWLDGHAEPTDRFVETLYKYVTRAAVKTSPYSTFATAGLAHWMADGPAVSIVGPARVRRVIQLNVAIAEQLRAHLAGLPGIRSALQVRLSPAIRFAGNKIRLLDPRGGERIRELRAVPSLVVVMKCLASERLWSYADFVDWLAATTGRSEVAAAAYLDRVIGMGIAEVVPSIPDQAVDRIAELAGTAELAAAPPGLVSRLTTVAAGLDRMRTVGLPGARLTARQELLDALDATYREASWPEAARLPRKHVCFEDCVFDSPQITLGSNAWQGVIGSLTALHAAAGMFDWNLMYRRAAARYFLRQHGPHGRIDFLTLCGEIAAGGDPVLATLLDHPQMYPTDTPDLFAEIITAQQRLRATINEYPERNGLRQVPAEAFIEAAEALPQWAAPPRSLAFYGHPLGGRNGRIRYVLNNVEGGHGRAAARVHRQLGTAPPQPTWADDEPETVYGEISASAGSNVNLRHGKAHAEISYPGVVACRPKSELIDLGELDVHYDPATDALQLTADRLGARVIPVHRGVMAEFLLPPAHRLLVQIFGDSPVCYLGEGLAGPRVGSAGEPYRCGRLVVGDVVVQRVTTAVPTSLIPRCANSTGPDFDYLMRVGGWCREHAIPERCFARVLPKPQSESAWRNKARKPLYLDLTCRPALTILNRLAGEPAETVLFQEALPLPEDALIEFGGRRHVGELVIELSRARTMAVRTYPLP